MSERIAVRIPQDLAESLDELVSSGRFETKGGGDRIDTRRPVVIELPHGQTWWGRLSEAAVV